MFSIEPDVGMPQHQAQQYFRQLIDGVVRQFNQLELFRTILNKQQ